MVFIPFPRVNLSNYPDLVNWLAKTSFSEGDWTQLKEYLSENSRISSTIHPITKCWYSELAQGDNYSLDVEHFRPKKQASPLTEKQVKELEKLSGIKINQSPYEGEYSWLEFDYRNYRIVSAITNRGGGKHIYFPIVNNTKRLKSGQVPWSTEEYPLLLDPTNKHDASLLFVKPNGEIAPIAPKTVLTDFDYANIKNRWNTDGFNYLRAIVTIKLYRLDNGIFVKGRKEIFDYITRQLETLSLLLQENPKSIIVERLIEDISKYALPSAQFSLAAQSALKSFSVPDGINQALNPLMKVICKKILSTIQEKVDELVVHF